MRAPSKSGEPGNAAGTPTIGELDDTRTSLVGLVLWLSLSGFLGIPIPAKRRMVLFVLGFPLPTFRALGALPPAHG